MLELIAQMMGVEVDWRKLLWLTVVAVSVLLFLSIAGIIDEDWAEFRQAVRKTLGVITGALVYAAIIGGLWLIVAIIRGPLR